MSGEGGGRRRLFVAVPVPEGVVPFALRAQGLLPKHPGLRLLGRDQLHFTLAFIGDADERKTAAAKGVVEGVPVRSGGEALIDGFLLLPTARRVRVVALNVQDDSGVFGGLFSFVMDGLEAAGVMQREKRPFHAHLTVARVKNSGTVQPTSDCGKTRFTVESVCLYESELSREGAKYTVLARKTLTWTNERETA